MLDERAVRRQLDEVSSALSKIEDERAALQAIKDSYIKWLDLHAGQNSQLPLEVVPPSATAPNGKTKQKPTFTKLGTVSLERAIIGALQNRSGTPMTSDEILTTAQNMGAKTNAGQPIRVVEWILYEIERKKKAPIKKLAPHRYVYESSAGRTSGVFPEASTI